MEDAKAPSLGSAGLGATQTTGGSRDWGEVQTIVFLSWDELARYGPMWVRLHLERRARRKGPGEVLEFGQ